MARASFRDPCPPGCKVYVGDLGNNGDRRELEDAFGRYGPLRNVWVARNPPGFAFVEFEEPRDAEDAARELDGRTLCGRRIRAEISNGRTKPKRFGDSRGGGRDYYDSRNGGGSGGRYGRDAGGGGGRYGRDDRYGGGGRDRERGGRGRSRSRSPRRERQRSRSPREGSERKSKREKSRSASPKPEETRRRGRAASDEKNGSPGGDKD